MKKTSNVTISISRNAFNTNEVLHDIQLGIIRPNAISWASENGYTEIAKPLIDLGADINENSNYPLELSCKNGHTEIVRMLIEAGAKPSTSHDKDYCLRIAAFHGYTAIAKLLLRIKFSTKWRLYGCCRTFNQLYMPNKSLYKCKYTNRKIKL